MSKLYGKKYINNPEDCLIDLYRKRGEVYRLIGNYEQAYGDFCKMEIGARLTDDENKQAGAIKRIGGIFLHKGKFKESETFFTQALKLYQKNTNRYGEAECYHQLGKTMQYCENNQKALAFYDDSLKIFTDLHDEAGKQLVLENIADNYRLNKKYNDALVILKEVLDYHKLSGDKVKLSHTLQMYGKIYSEMGEFEKGIDSLMESYALATITREKIAMVYILCDLGLANYDNCQYIEAKELFEKCFDLSEKQNLSYMSAVSLLNLGDTCIKLKKNDLAKINLQKVRDMDINIEGIKNEADRLLKQINSD